MKKLVIIGASGHGKVVADIAEKSEYEEIVFLDDNKNLKECAGFPVVGKSHNIEEYKDWSFFVAIGNASIRQKIQSNLLLQKYHLTILVHPQAVVSKRVNIGLGTVVMAGAVINSDAEIGRGCIINTGSTVDHDCVLKDYVHVAVGAHLAGNTCIGERTWIGAGAVVCNNVNICSDCMVGAGAAVVKDIETPGTYVGVPAKQIEKISDNRRIYTNEYFDIGQ